MKKARWRDDSGREDRLGWDGKLHWRMDLGKVDRMQDDMEKHRWRVVEGTKERRLRFLEKTVATRGSRDERWISRQVGKPRRHGSSEVR
jgi:hypothetical protein